MLNESKVREARRILDKYLEMASQETGIQFKIGNISYNTTGMHTRLEGCEINAETGEVKVDQVKEHKARWALRGIWHDKDNGSGYNGPVIGRVVITTTGQGKIVDFNSRSHKYPFVVEMSGTKYKMSARCFKEIL